MVRDVFPDKPYISLDDPKNCDFFFDDIGAWFAAYPDGAIIDDLSDFWNWSWFLAVFESFKQEISGNFLFVATSSAPCNNEILRGVPCVQLYPLSLPELYLWGKAPESLFSFIFNGGLPAFVKEGQDRSIFFSKYLKTVAIACGVGRNGQPIDERYMNFLVLCANRIACPLNASEIGRNCAVSACTATRWINDLEKKGVVFLLPASERSFGKRSGKAPILYFCDTGFACYLAGIADSRRLIFDRMRDLFFENQIILELMKKAANKGEQMHFHHWRENRGARVPLLHETAKGIASFFIHTGLEPDVPFIKWIRRLLRRLGLDKTLCVLVYAGAKEKVIHGIHILPWQRIHEINMEQWPALNGLRLGPTKVW